MAHDKLVALKASWGLSPSGSPDPHAPQPGRSAEMYRGGDAILDPGPYLPRQGDTFETWITRNQDAIGREFGLMAPCIECASWDAMERLRAVLEPVLELTGPRSYRFNVFAGDYRQTPFGFHVDPHQEAVFQVVLQGRRRGLFWEGLALSEDEDASWIEDSNRLHTPAKPPDVVVDLEPGDVVFWPGTQVHGFEAEGPSLALSIVVDRASVRQRHEVVSGLEVASMQGAAALPPPLPDAKVRPEDALRRRSSMRLTYERYDDTLILGVCGRTIDWPSRISIADVIALTEHLAAREHMVAGEVAKACATDVLDEDDILGTLSMLVALGYLAPARAG
jgi:hypothetical protein